MPAVDWPTKCITLSPLGESGEPGPIGEAFFAGFGLANAPGVLTLPGSSGVTSLLAQCCPCGVNTGPAFGSAE